MFIGSYLIGSIPTAFLLVRRQAGIDIRTAGSGNIGGFNAFRVTNSRWIGLAVGVLDGVKGAIVVVLIGSFIGWNFWMQSLGLISSMIGHNYPIWLKFRGGRGLATAAGGSLILGIPGFVVWGITWLVTYRLTKDILYGNLAAILLTPTILFALPERWLAFLLPSYIIPSDYVLMMCAVSIVHIFRHLDVVKLLASGSPSTDR